MDRARILAQFDAEMRAQPEELPGTRVERLGSVTRVVGASSWIIHWSLDSSTAPAAVSEQTAYFRTRVGPVEWKVFGHDAPPELGDLLRAGGYVPDPSETLEVFDLSRTLVGGPRTGAVEVRRVGDAAGLSTAIAVSAQAFGEDRAWSTEEFARRLQDPALALFVAFVHGVPVASGRLEMPPGRSFASLWGGGTAPSFRGQGVYRALVEARADLARARGYRYLTVDALPTSRPILERLGFEPLTTMTGWVLTP